MAVIFRTDPQAKGERTGTIEIYEDVGGGGWFGDEGTSAKSFAKELKNLGPIDRLDIHISSFGGEVFDGFAIYRQLADHPARKTVHVDGIAASIASVIAMAGNEIIVSEAGFIMIHNAWGMAIGDSGDIRAYADRLDSLSGTIADVYVARTGQKKEKILEMMAAETWMDGKDAVELGFANRVAENVRVAAKLDPTRHKFVNMPKVLVPSNDERQDPGVSLVPDEIRNMVKMQALRSASRVRR